MLAYVHAQHRHNSKEGGGGKNSIDTKICTCTSYIILYYYIIIRKRKLCTTKYETKINLFSDEKILGVLFYIFWMYISFDI